MAMRRALASAARCAAHTRPWFEKRPTLGKLLLGLHVRALGTDASSAGVAQAESKEEETATPLTVAAKATQDANHSQLADDAWQIGDEQALKELLLQRGSCVGSPFVRRLNGALQRM